VSIASLDNNNNPTVTPIGSLFLRRDQTGFYFEKFLSKLSLHQEGNDSVCVLAVNSNKWFWLKSLTMGKFYDYPAIKLYGKLESRRRASEKEIKLLKKRMRYTWWMKGHHYLWGDMKYVRDISFSNVEKIQLGEMTAALR
jgi:hypothetical protein